MIAYKRMVMSVLRWMLFPVRWLRCRRDGVVHTAGRQTIPNEQLFAVVTEVLREGHTAVIWVKGYSMRPFLEHERDRVKLAAPGQVKVGDAVLAQIAPGRYVLHRILNMDDDRITLQGDGNLVGVVTEAGMNWCTVATILDTTSAIGAKVFRTEQVAVAQGRLDLMSQSCLSLTYLEDPDNLISGDLIVTSGLGGYYPSGLVIGTVKELRTDVGGLTQYAVVTPSAAVMSLTQVFLVTGFDVVE